MKITGIILPGEQLSYSIHRDDLPEEKILKPDVCLIDVVLKDISRIECGKRLKRKSRTFIL